MKGVLAIALMAVLSAVSFLYGWWLGATNTYRAGMEAAVAGGRHAYHASKETPTMPTLAGYCVALSAYEKKCVTPDVLDALVLESVR